MEYILSNRDKKLKPKRGLFWCDSCDRCLVANWEKCPVCGNRSGKKTLKGK